MRIKYMYEKGDSSYLNLLLEARSLSELLNRAEYVSKISEYDRKMSTSMWRRKSPSRTARKKLETEKAELQEMKTQTEAKQDSVQLLLNEKIKNSRTSTRRSARNQRRRKRDEDDIKAQEAKIVQMEAEINEEGSGRGGEKSGRGSCQKSRRSGKDE
ncbi:MAG: coiled-coil domain-containing protein [Clostridium fessum]